MEVTHCLRVRGGPKPRRQLFDSEATDHALCLALRNFSTQESSAAYCKTAFCAAIPEPPRH